MDSRYYKSDHSEDDAFQNMFKHSAQMQAIKQALHISKPNSFSKLNNTVAAQITDRNENTAGLFSQLLSRGIQILISVGHFDMKDGVRQTLEWTKQIQLPSRSFFDL